MSRPYGSIFEEDPLPRRQEGVRIELLLGGVELGPAVAEVADTSLRFDRTVKLAAYRDAGVPEVWFADPMPRRFQVLTLSPDGKEYVERGVFGPGEAIASAFLPGLRLEVDRIFPRLL